MQSIPPYQPAIKIFSHAGLVATCDSLEAALSFLGDSWVEAYVYAYRFGELACKPGFILRTEAGEEVAPEAILSLYRARMVFRGRRWRSFNEWNGTGPVPGTGRPRGGHYYRRIRNANERRQAFWIAEEGEVAPRPARNFKNLPDNWDDYRVSARESRSWKRFRKTQYKG